MHLFTKVRNRSNQALMPRSVILPVLIAVSASMVCNAQRAEPTATREREVFNAGGVGFEMSWRVSQERLDASQWNTKSDPPLSVSQAVTKARSYLASHGKSSQLPVAWVQLLHVEDAPPTCFVYVLQFGDLAQNPSNGNLIIMLLDGSVVVPVTTKTDK
jgi:hypothetical protein